MLLVKLPVCKPQIKHCEECRFWDAGLCYIEPKRELRRSKDIVCKCGESNV